MVTFWMTWPKATQQTRRVGSLDMYELLLMLSNPDTASLIRLQVAIVETYASHSTGESPTLQIVGDRLTVRFGTFHFHIDVGCQPHVLEESREIAAEFAIGMPQQAAIAACACRFELTSDDDPDMDYFNDMAYLTEAAESLGGVYTFDSRAGAFH